MSSAGLTFRRVLTAHVAALVGVVVIVHMLVPGDVWSAIFGSGVGVLGNGYAVWRVFVRSTKKPDQNELFVLYRAEFGKLAIVGVLCAAIFAAVDGIRIVGFLAGLVSGLIAVTVAAATQKMQLPIEDKTQN